MKGATARAAQSPRGLTVSPAVGLPGSVCHRRQLSESRWRASGRRDPLSRLAPGAWRKPSWVVLSVVGCRAQSPAWSWLLISPPRRRGGRGRLVLWRFADWPHRVTRARNGFAGGGAFSVVKPSLVWRGSGRSVRCWCQGPPGRPHDVRHRRLLYCRAVPRVEGVGEKCLQSQAVRDAGVVWAGGVTFRLEYEDAVEI